MHALEEETAPDQSPPRAAWPLRLLLAVSVLLLLLAAAAEWGRPDTPANDPTPEGPGPMDTLIEPGHRVGFILLGMPVSEVEKRLGKSTIRPSDGALLYLFDRYGLGCGVQKERIVSVRVLTPEFRTRGGVGVGVDVDLAIREFGGRYDYQGDKPVGAKLPENYTLHYWPLGIHVTVKRTLVESLLITQPVEGSES